MLLEGMDLARQIGDRGMYYWLAGTASPGLVSEGRGWDAHIPVMEEALETATLRYDRRRLRSLLGLFQMSRGEKMRELVEDIAELVAGSTDPEDLFTLYTMAGATDMLTGDLEAAYAKAMKTLELKTQIPEVPLSLAARSAIWSRSLERARHANNLIADLPATGSLTQAMRAHSAAAIAALEGRATEAVAGFRDVDARMRKMEQFFDAARYAVDAAVLLPDHPDIRALVDEARPLLVELRAQPYLDRLEAALGDAQTASQAPTPTGAASSPLTPVK